MSLTRFMIILSSHWPGHETWYQGGWGEELMILVSALSGEITSAHLGRSSFITHCKCPSLWLLFYNSKAQFGYCTREFKWVSVCARWKQGWTVVGGRRRSYTGDVITIYIGQGFVNAALASLPPPAYLRSCVVPFCSRILPSRPGVFSLPLSYILLPGIQNHFLGKL